MDTLKVTIDSEKNLISVMNNGRGIPVEVGDRWDDTLFQLWLGLMLDDLFISQIHETEGIYIPELIFGHLLAGSNFDDDEKKTTGGRNGYGAS